MEVDEDTVTVQSTMRVTSDLLNNIGVTINGACGVIDEISREIFLAALCTDGWIR